MFGYVIFSIIVVALLYGAYRWWGMRIERELREGAAYEYEYLNAREPDFLAGMSEAAFTEIYMKVERPRGPGYGLAIIATFLAITPLGLALLAGGDWAMHRLGIIPTPADVVGTLMLDDDGTARFVGDVPPEALQYYVEDLGGFYYFFGMLAVWIGVVWFFMRLYHRRRPGMLRDEIIRAR